MINASAESATERHRGSTCEVCEPADGRLHMVTDEMTQAACDKYHECGPFDSEYPSFVRMRAALEAADRAQARKPGYRQVTIEDARALRLKWDSLFYGCGAMTMDESLHDALQHINAFIKED